MPIINPSLHCFLIKNLQKTKCKNSYSFYLKYLLIASRKLNRTQKMIEASIQFKKDLIKSISTVNHIFGCNFSYKQDFANRKISDYYKYLFSYINLPDNESDYKKITGEYYMCNDKFNTKFFQPHILYSEYHSWYFTDTPTAILCIDSEKFTFSDNEKQTEHEICQLIKLEIDLISASGLSLVLCVKYSPNILNFLLQIITDNQFSEVHFNISDPNQLSNFIQKVSNSNFDCYKGYFYLYTRHINKKSKERILMKMFKQKPRVKILSFAVSPEKAFISIDSAPTKPFSYCKTGFNYNYLRIYLCYVPIYDTESDNDSFIPSEVSGFCLAYVSPNDFLFWRKKRVKILFDDEKDNHHHCFKYINYDDMHLIKSDLFMNDALALTKIRESRIRQIEQIKEKVDQEVKNQDKFKKKYLFNLLHEKKYLTCLRYVTYAYSKLIKYSIPDFDIHKSQIYAAFEACRTCFSKKKDKNNPKGVIYQVETGEGKSCIVCLIAAVLAINKKTVHIASSNIKLSNRDYYNSLDFFNALGLSSAVLLHENELPYSENNTTNKDNNNSNLNDDDIREYDPYFKNNADYYFDNNSKNNTEEIKKSYPTKFFDKELFKNPSRMNFSVCGVDNNNNISKYKANVIFSTFVNFECFYLHLMEMCPGYIENYFKKCSLLIDEADSILIDEIANGTIVSREMKSNAKEVLSFVFKQKKEFNKSPKETFELLKNKPMCEDIKLNDIEQMYKDIDTVYQDEYSNGKKYRIETFEVKNNNKIFNLIRKTIKTVKELPDTIFNTMIKKLKRKEEEEEDENEDEYDEDEKYDTCDSKKFKMIIPFDFNHKGILEPNKEFSGFIQQFISLKEGKKEGNEDLIFKDLSINYLYISHPIFANLYGNICGFTGTVGDRDDKKIYKKHYHLITQKVPRNKPNYRVSFPTIICDTFEERNQKIVSEVIEFHNKKHPVLVIFQDMSEIEIVEYMLYTKGIRYINVFDGRDEIIRPDKISGIKGAVTLGTNVCGRGTDIQCLSLPLHIIVSFYSSNSRVMNQAFGRTARQGQNGTCRCICHKNQYFSKVFNFNDIKMKNIIGVLDYKIIAQQQFIEFYKKDRPWIFSYTIENQNLPKKVIMNLRKARINVNRIVAYKYKFPICMSLDTFLTIQSQKIFSIINCPNCKYTWKLFQRYVREMVLESWSIMIRNIDQDNVSNEDPQKFKRRLDLLIDKVHSKLEKYLPPEKFDIVSTFMNIFNTVLDKYESKVLNSFKKLKNVYLSFNASEFTLFQLGFKPYSLLDCSGARISYNNVDETNFIRDPELKYERKMPDNKFTIISITERIDDIFNKIFQKISSMLGEKVYLKFFLRRTLAGCEFGVCFDVHVMNFDEEILNEKNCLIDRDPLLVFTIFLRSMAPLLAGILIFILVYVSGLSMKIYEWIGAFPEEVVKQGVIKAVNLVVPALTDFFLEKLIDFLEVVLDKQLLNLENDKKALFIITELRRLLLGKEFDKVSEIITDKLSDLISTILGGKVKIPSFVCNLFEESLNVSLLMKIGILLLLCLGTYIRNVLNHKLAIKHAKSRAKEFDSIYDKKNVKMKSTKSSSIIVNKDKNVEKSTKSYSTLPLYENENAKLQANEKLDEIVKNGKDSIELDDIENLSKDVKNKFIESYKSVSQTIDYQFKSSQLKKYELSYKNFQMVTGSFNVGNAQIVINKFTKMKYIRKELKSKILIQLIKIYLSVAHPAISTFAGYAFKSYKNKKKSYVYVEYKDKGYLSIQIEEHSLNLTNKLIIAYGIACGFEYLHNHQITHRNLTTNSVLLDSHSRPFIIEFGESENMDEIGGITNVPYKCMTPELMESHIESQSLFKLDVYSFGILLFELYTETEAYASDDGMILIIQKVINGERPQIPESVSPNWKDLIQKCWSQDPSMRPTFSEICDFMESELFVNSSIDRFAFGKYMNLVKPYRPGSKQ